MQAGTDVKFKVGDKAVYPKHGVGEIVRIVELDIAGARQKFYEVKTLDKNQKTVKIPVATAESDQPGRKAFARMVVVESRASASGPGQTGDVATGTVPSSV